MVQQFNDYITITKYQTCSILPFLEMSPKILEDFGRSQSTWYCERWLDRLNSCHQHGWTQGSGETCFALGFVMGDMMGWASNCREFKESSKGLTRMGLIEFVQENLIMGWGWISTYTIHKPWIARFVWCDSDWIGNPFTHLWRHWWKSENLKSPHGTWRIFTSKKIEGVMWELLKRSKKCGIHQVDNMVVYPFICRVLYHHRWLFGISEPSTVWPNTHIWS